MESIIFLSVLVGICVIAYLLGLRDQKNSEKVLLQKLKKNFGDAPKRNYKSDDLDHIQGYYNNHKGGHQIDAITWNDLNMDGVFARMTGKPERLRCGEDFIWESLLSQGKSARHHKGSKSQPVRLGFLLFCSFSHLLFLSFSPSFLYSLIFIFFNFHILLTVHRGSRR